MTLLIVILAALIPANVMNMVSTRDLVISRDRWLIVILTLGTIWLAWQPGYMWLALMALWHLCRWRDDTLHASLLLWSAIGLTWFFLSHVHPEVYAFISWAWVVLALIQVVICLNRLRHRRAQTRPSLGQRSTGTLGSPVLTAFYFTIAAPFCPWWFWPILAIGFYVTCSWSAFLGLATVVVWLWPSMLWFAIAGTLLVGGVWWWSPTVRGQRIFEWLPRGDSIDGWRARVILVSLLCWHWWTGSHHWLGYGPESAIKMSRQWTSRQNTELPNGEAHHDAVQILYEYGLLGTLALLAFIVPIVPHLTFGDPWSAAWIALVVLSCGHWPLHHPVLGLMWLTISAKLA